jgi:hypothetical protein
MPFFDANVGAPQAVVREALVVAISGRELT